MKHTLVFKGDKVRILFPVNGTFKKGDEVTVNNKQEAEMLESVGFEVKKEKKEKGGNE